MHSYLSKILWISLEKDSLESKLNENFFSTKFYKDGVNYFKIWSSNKYSSFSNLVTSKLLSTVSHQSEFTTGHIWSNPILLSFRSVIYISFKTWLDSNLISGFLILFIILLRNSISSFFVPNTVPSFKLFLHNLGLRF